MFRILILFCLLSCLSFSEIKQDIYQALQKEQWQHNSEFIFGLRWERTKGLYASDIKFNVVDKDNSWKSADMRKFNVEDSNMFVTNFVLMALLEVAELSPALEIDEKSLHLALEAVLSFKDRNYAPELPIFNFWKQKLLNDTWVAYPSNLDHLVRLYPNFPPIVQKWLDRNGFGIFNQVKDISQAFRIPADNDDSSVNIALGVVLERMKSRFPSLTETFQSSNFDVAGFYREALRLSYRPFEKGGRDTIDPRSYFYLSPFLEAQQGESLILAATWLIDDAGQKRGLVEMPLLVNNVDVSVNANFLFGLTNAVLAGKVQLEGELRQMYGDIGKLLVWAINSGIVEQRPDIALLYYPSQFDFYWFNSRITKLVERYGEVDPLISETAEAIRDALKTHGTRFLLSRLQCSEEECFADEFLGDFAGKSRGEDRVFATALAANALLDTWTDAQGHWLPESQVKETTAKAIRFLENHFSDSNHLNNAFFSGSIKGTSSVHIFYPTNVDIDAEGNTFDPQKSAPQDLKPGVKCAWQGFMTLQEYQTLVQQKWFGLDVPTTFEGFNSEPGAGFPFWSSRAISQAVALLAVSKFELI